MLTYFKEVPLQEGFEILSRSKEDRLVQGRKVTAPAGFALFSSLNRSGAKIKCWCCGIEATCFVVNKGSRDLIGHPYLDLFAVRNGAYILMTRDHIIPKSKGGVDDVQNLRPGCSDCNGARGSKLSKTDKLFMKAHPELINPERAKIGAERAAKAAELLKRQKAEAEARKFERAKSGKAI